MQDKNLHINKNFTDRAWGEMRNLLDQELPAEAHKKSRPLFWWFTGGTAIAAALVGFYFINNAVLNNNEDIINTNTDLTVENEGGINPELNSSLNTNPKTLTGSNLNSISDNLTNKKNHPLNPVIKKTKVENYSEKNTSENKNNIVIKDFGQITVESEKTLNPLSNSINIPEAKEIKIIEDAILAVFEEKNHPVKSKANKIEYLQINTLSIDNKINPVHLLETFPSKRNKHAIYASTIFKPESKTNGLSIGYLRNIGIGKKRWTLQMGFGYSHISQPIEYIVYRDYDLAGQNTGLPVVTNEDLLDLSYANSNEVRIESNIGSLDRYSDGAYNRLRLHYLTVPVCLNYEKGRWQLKGGIQANMLMAASNKSLNGGLLENFGKSTNDPSLSSNADFSYLSNIDIAATLGGGFRLTNRYSIHLSYLHGLKDVIKYNSEKDYNRLFQLSAQYSW